jgi:preprotein translocase subunit SecB
LTRRDLDAFVTRTATDDVWPYWREFVQSMTTRMGLPPMTIPTLDLQVILDHQEKKPRKANSPKKKKFG